MSDLDERPCPACGETDDCPHYDSVSDGLLGDDPPEDYLLSDDPTDLAGEAPRVQS